MLTVFRTLGLSAALAGGLFCLTPARADEPATPAQDKATDEIPMLNLLDAAPTARLQSRPKGPAMAG